MKSKVIKIGWLYYIVNAETGNWYYENKFASEYEDKHHADAVSKAINLKF